MLFPIPEPPKPSFRVVITGAGMVTALGVGWDTNAAGFRSGRMGIGPVRRFDVSRQRVQVAGELNQPLPSPLEGNRPRRFQRLDRAAQLLLVSAREAWEDAGWQRPDPLPVVLGTSSGGMGLGEAYYQQALQSPERLFRQASRAIYYQAQRQGLDLQEAFGFRGPISIIANACASGANAIGHAWQMLRAGQCDCLLAGGYDAISRLVFAGFDSLQALSPTQCRPFDAQRDGLALGEGAAVFALETLEHARGRGARILGEIAGYGAATDPHHLTQPQPEGDAAWLSMNRACQSAGLDPKQIDYVNAHGTATPLNDSAEAKAINRWAGERAATLPVSSTKGAIGHLLGAAGAVEAGVCLMALQGQWLPPTCSTHEPDPVCQFRLVQQPGEASLEYALSNSFGFGGANATVILRRGA